MRKKYIVVLRASRISSNNKLEEIFKNNIYNIITFPILKVEILHSDPINPAGAQAVLTTSTNAIQIFSELSKNRKTTIYTVGSTSKEVAKNLGYKNVIDCEGDSVKMYNKVLNDCSKHNGDLVYIGADSISLDLPKMLRKVGFKVKRYIVYKTREVDMIDDKFLKLLEQKRIKWIVLLSKKGASCFNKLVMNNIKFNQLEKIKFACLSESIAAELNDRIKLKFFPEQPTLDRLKFIIMQNE